MLLCTCTSSYACIVIIDLLKYKSLTLKEFIYLFYKVVIFFCCQFDSHKTIMADLNGMKLLSTPIGFSKGLEFCTTHCKRDVCIIRRTKKQGGANTHDHRCETRFSVTVCLY